MRRYRLWRGLGGARGVLERKSQYQFGSGGAVPDTGVVPNFFANLGCFRSAKKEKVGTSDSGPQTIVETEISPKFPYRGKFKLVI